MRSVLEVEMALLTAVALKLSILVKALDRFWMALTAVPPKADTMSPSPEGKQVETYVRNELSVIMVSKLAASTDGYLRS